MWFIIWNRITEKYLKINWKDLKFENLGNLNSFEFDNDSQKLGKIIYMWEIFWIGFENLERFGI